jgi:hypothetical protein
MGRKIIVDSIRISNHAEGAGESRGFSTPDFWVGSGKDSRQGVYECGEGRPKDAVAAALKHFGIAD